MPMIVAMVIRSRFTETTFHARMEVRTSLRDILRKSESGSSGRFLGTRGHRFQWVGPAPCGAGGLRSEPVVPLTRVDLGARGVNVGYDSMEHQ